MSETYTPPVRAMHKDYYKWDSKPTTKQIKDKAPEGSVCAIVYGSVWGWTKEVEVAYFHVDMDVNEPYFPSEPINQYSIMKRKKLSLC